jgi:hypothetical protein
MLDRQIDGVFHVFANHRGRCGQRGDKADFTLSAQPALASAVAATAASKVRFIVTSQFF